jgi:hypothetical protein
MSVIYSEKLNFEIIGRLSKLRDQSERESLLRSIRLKTPQAARVNFNILNSLMMEAARTSETLVNFYQTTRRYNPEDSHLRTHRRENLRSYLILTYFISVRDLFNDAVSISDYIASNDGIIINELEISWKKAIVTQFKAVSQPLPGGAEENHAQYQ